MVAVTVMGVLLFVLHVCMLRECEGVDNAGMGDAGSVVMVSAGHLGGTCGSEIVSSTADVLEMSEVCGMRGVGGVCEMCLARGGVGGRIGGEWMRELGLGFTNPVGTGGVLDVGGIGGEWVDGLDWGLEGEELIFLK